MWDRSSSPQAGRRRFYAGAGHPRSHIFANPTFCRRPPWADRPRPIARRVLGSLIDIEGLRWSGRMDAAAVPVRNAAAINKPPIGLRLRGCVGDAAAGVSTRAIAACPTASAASAAVELQVWVPMIRYHWIRRHGTLRDVQIMVTHLNADCLILKKHRSQRAKRAFSKWFKMVTKKSGPASIDPRSGCSSNAGSSEQMPSPQDAQSRSARRAQAGHAIVRVAAHSHQG